MAQEIPRRFNIEAVSRYAHVMEMVCEAWPSPVLVDPKPLSIETFRQRFRDAVKGAVVYSQAPESCREKLGKIHSEISLTEEKGKLVIGPRELLRSRIKAPSGPSKPGLLVSGIATLAGNGEPFASPDKAVIEALCTLLSYGFLSDARLSGVDAVFVETHLPADYEGGVMENADGSLTLY